MKNTATLFALAAGLSQATATGAGFGGGFGFVDAPKFHTPGNSDSFCLPEWKKGFDWSDLSPGSFQEYGGFKWSGFTRADKFTKRDGLVTRTLFGDKCITGKATREVNNSPKISCDVQKGTKNTSIKEFHVQPEFDCDLEFHYDMPDGSSCKHRSPCSKDGSIVKNTQCGGATDVTILFPDQPKAPKKDCDFAIPKIIFDCDDAPKSSAQPPASTASYPGNTPPVSTTSSAVETTSSVVESQSTSSGVETTSSGVVTTSSAIVTTSSAVETTSSGVESESYPGGSLSTSSGVETTSSAVETTSSAVETTSGVESASESYPAQSPPTSSGVESATTSVPAESTFTSLTSYMTTSTIFSTSVEVITSCGPSVTNCPGGFNNTATVTSVIAISTTICPVTETITSVSSGTGVPSTSVPEQPGQPSETGSVPSGTVPSETAPSGTVPSGTTEVPVGSSSSPPGPVETLPCPNVVPSCLNTWLGSVGCKDNTDASCYCPSKEFVDNVFDCLYSHGESDDVVSEAISYFQGICAPHAGENPGIVTYPDTYVPILTPTAAPPAEPTAVYTTIEVVTTAVVPCTGPAGEPSSSTTTVSTVVSVPDVGFHTVTEGSGSTSVVVVPAPSVTPPAGIDTPAPSTANGGGYPTSAFATFTTPAPVGTGGVPVPTSSFPPIATGGASRQGAAFGLAGAIAVAVFAL